MNSGKVVWELSSGFGKGYKNYNLVPFITIAVDTAIIPIGSVIYIPKAKGVKYADSEGKIVEHDGYFLLEMLAVKSREIILMSFWDLLKQILLSFLNPIKQELLKHI